MLRHTLRLTTAIALLMSSVAYSGYAQETEVAKPASPQANAPAPQHPSSQAAAPAASPADEKKGDEKKEAPTEARPAAPQQPTSSQTNAPATPPGDEKQKVSTEAQEPQKIIWPFNGMTGHVDKQAAQRGFQIYSQVCSVCHSMNLVAYRNLGELGFSEAEIKALASQKQVDDFDDNGQRIQRPGKPFDHFVPPYPNEKASRAANNGAYPPDLSLIVKARELGPDYVYSILTGFGNAPAGETPVTGKYYNPYFQGHWISMPPPLRDGAVTYQDGTNASVDQMARDVVNFLQWAAEPEMDQRHEMGIKVLIFLCVMAGLFYVAKKRVWKNLKH